MNESSFKRTVVVGVFVFLGTLFLVGGILLIGNLRKTFTRTIELVARFDDINGLQKGNNIWYSGVKVGTVSDVSFYGKSQVEVLMNVETKSSEYIRKDAKVKVSSDGFIGNKILVIYGGDTRFAQVENGDTLEVEKTFSSEDVINTLQANNKNVLEITSDVKVITKKLAAGEGTIGKLLHDSTIYLNITTATNSLQAASVKAQQILVSLEKFSSNLNNEGTLAHDLTTDTVVFESVRNTVLQLQQMADTASAMVVNLKQSMGDANSPMGVLLHDEASGLHLKETIKNLESSSEKLDEDLEAVQHSWPFRRFFRKKAKAEKKAEKANE